MIQLYFHSNNLAKRKAVKWFSEHVINVNERNIKKNPLTEKEITHLLTISVNGTDELISKGSKVVRDSGDIDSMTVSELTNTIARNPQILRNPIIADKHKVLGGFDSERIGMFIPKKIRKLELASLFNKINHLSDNNVGLA